MPDNIGLRVPAIAKEYYTLTRRREKEFVSIFENFITQGIFRADIPAAVLRALVTQIFIAGDFWLSNNELTLKLKESKAITHYSEIFSSLFYPYLMQSGQRVGT